jgi:hypothetical protein
MQRMFAAEAAKFLEFQTLRGLLFILIGYVITIFTITALQYDVVAHNK